jgi:hypothetical protein
MRVDSQTYDHRPTVDSYTQSSLQYLYLVPWYKNVAYVIMHAMLYVQHIHSELMAVKKVFIFEKALYSTVLRSSTYCTCRFTLCYTVGLLA